MSSGIAAYLQPVKEVVLRENKKNSAITNGVTWALYTALGAYAATQASRLHKFAPLAITGGLFLGETIESSLTGKDKPRVWDFTSSKWAFLPVLRGALIAVGVQSAIAATPLLRNAIKLGRYDVAFAKQFAIAAGPTFLTALRLATTNVKYTGSKAPLSYRAMMTLDAYRKSKPGVEKK